MFLYTKTVAFMRLLYNILKVTFRENKAASHKHPSKKLLCSPLFPQTIAPNLGQNVVDKLPKLCKISFSDFFEFSSTVVKTISETIFGLGQFLTTL